MSQQEPGNNSIIKSQWLNKIFLFGEKTIKIFNTIEMLNNDIILLCSRFMQDSIYICFKIIGEVDFKQNDNKEIPFSEPKETTDINGVGLIINNKQYIKHTIKITRQPFNQSIMNLDEQLQQLKNQTCPRQIDVVDSVMAQVRQHPYMINKSVSRSKVIWRRISVSAAAAIVILFVLNTTVFRPQSYNEEQIGSMIALVSDYDYYAPIESAAEDPLEYLYSEYYDNQY